MLGFFIVVAVAALACAWLLNPSAGPLGWMAGGFGAAAFKLAMAALVLASGTALTYIGLRLATQFGRRPRPGHADLHARPPARRRRQRAAAAHGR